MLRDEYQTNVTGVWMAVATFVWNMMTHFDLM